jgi:hypothetical protein
MKRGEVLARGNRVDLNNDGILQENECYFDYGLDLQPGQEVKTIVGPGCTILLDDFRENQPLLAAIPPKQFFAQLWDKFFPRLHAQSYPYQKGIYGHIYGYGLGGSGIDGVTAQQGWTEWEHNGFNEGRMLHSGGWYCTANYSYPPQGCLPLLGIPPMASKNMGWEPLLGQWTDAFWGPGWEIGRLDYSQFRFVPEAYRHYLYVRRRGYGNGTGNCPMWVDGAVPPGGTYQACYYYNLPWPYGYRP